MEEAKANAEEKEVENLDTHTNHPLTKQENSFARNVGKGREIARMQLRKKQGFRDIHCKSCKHHARCGDYLYECKAILHHCMTHWIDPSEHRSTRAPNDAKEKDEEAVTKLDHRRKALTCSTKRKDVGSRTKQCK